MRLSPEQKLFLVDELAMHSTPTEAARAFEAEYDMPITRTQVQCFDPSKAAGARLSRKLRDRFAETRAKFDERVLEQRIANRAWRLRRLAQYEAQAFANGDTARGTHCLEQAAKEVGDSFTNFRNIRHAGSLAYAVEPRSTEECRALLADKLLDAFERPRR
jgi:hypothetical protein